MAHILLVDDDVRMARLVEAYLRNKGHRVAICADPLRVLDSIAKDRPDLLILDVTMLNMNGIELCRRIRERFHQLDLPILFLSARDTADDRIQGLEAGADDYLVKPFDMRELELRIEALLRRSGALYNREGSSQLEVGKLTLNTHMYKSFVENREVQLTPVEYELLHYLMLRANQVISAEQLLQEVWRYYPGTGDTAVVRVQIMNLRDKIELDRRHPIYIQTVYRHGYMFSSTTQ